jgi:hypothetical protein
MQDELGQVTASRLIVTRVYLVMLETGVMYCYTPHLVCTWMQLDYCALQELLQTEVLKTCYERYAERNNSGEFIII